MNIWSFRFDHQRISTHCLRNTWQMNHWRCSYRSLPSVDLCIVWLPANCECSRLHRESHRLPLWCWWWDVRRREIQMAIRVSALFGVTLTVNCWRWDCHNLHRCSYDADVLTLNPTWLSCCNTHDSPRRPLWCYFWTECRSMMFRARQLPPSRCWDLAPRYRCYSCCWESAVAASVSTLRSMRWTAVSSTWLLSLTWCRLLWWHFRSIDLH